MHTRVSRGSFYDDARFSVNEVASLFRLHDHVQGRPVLHATARVLKLTFSEDRTPSQLGCFP